MKEQELREVCICQLCKRKLGEVNHPIFYRFEIRQFVLNGAAIQRQQGLGMMMNGNGEIAMAMGPNENMAEEAGDPTNLTICMDCMMKPVEPCVLSDPE